MALMDSDFVHNAFMVDTPRRSLMLLTNTRDERDAWVRVCLLLFWKLIFIIFRKITLGCWNQESIG